MCVPAAVVDVSEVIDVNQQQRTFALKSRCTEDGLVQFVLNARSVEQSRERVVFREPRQARYGIMAFRHVQPGRDGYLARGCAP